MDGCVARANHPARSYLTRACGSNGLRNQVRSDSRTGQPCHSYWGPLRHTVRWHQNPPPSPGVSRMVEVLKRKRVLAGLGAVVALVAAGAAIAYFTSTGSGNGTGSVGNASNWTVAIAAPSGGPPPPAGGPLSPGPGSQTFAYTVTNASSGHQQLQATASSVLADANGDI